VGIDLGFVGAYGLGVLLARKAFFATPGSSKVTLYFIVGLVSMAAVNLLTIGFGRGTAEATAQSMVAGAVVMAVVASTEIREIWAGVAVHFWSVGLMLLAPRYASLICVAALGLDTLVYLWAFRRHAGRATLR
jgi:hypothetical protein